MKLSISNIAWPATDDEAIYTLLAELQFDGIEVAPGRLFHNPFRVTASAIKACKASLQPYNLRFAAMQSLLYKKSDLTIFDTDEQRVQTMTALKAMINLGAELGVHALVFGSPKNRLMGKVTPAKQEIARVFFGKLGDYAQEQGVVFALEPNPSIYGGDFLLTTTETIDFVESVGCAGLKLNLDVGALIENSELDTILQALPDKISLIGHVHLSRLSLKPLVIDAPQVAVINKLKEVDYKGWTSIEMLADTENPLTEQRTMLSTVRELTRA